MRIVWSNDKYRLNARVYPRGEEHSCITVSREKRYDKEDFDPPTINWAAWGAQPIEVAYAYAMALKAAVKIAGEMNRKVRRYEVTYGHDGERGTEIVLGNNDAQVSSSIGISPNFKVISILEL